MGNSGLEETIAAVSTPPGESGIGIVRLSGEKSLDIANSLFIRAKGVSSPIKPHHVYYGYIVNPGDTHPVDEVLLTYMKAPKSYTGEDVVEINCHGGFVPTKRILDLCLECGARPAEPGEFTKRAFISGRIDLAQAEAVIDVIKSRTEMALRLAMKQLKGDLSQKLLELSQAIIDLLANVEASLDFPEDDLEGLERVDFEDRMITAKEEIERLILSYREGKMVREGLTIPIIGRPNVGKSSLLNRMLQCERAIVTPVPGTTRDTIEAELVIGGLLVQMIDTAGLRACEDLVEAEGVRRARAAIEQADIIVFMLDATEGVTEEDERIAEEIHRHRVMAVVNKIDLVGDRERSDGWQLQKRFEELKISAKLGWGIEQLKGKINEFAKNSGVGDGEGIVITRVRHLQALKNAREALKGALATRKNGLSLEFLAVDLREALDQFGLITGQVYTEEILDKVFSQFCIGK